MKRPRKLRNKIAQAVYDFLLWVASTLALPGKSQLDDAIVSGIVLAFLLVLFLLAYLIQLGI